MEIIFVNAIKNLFLKRSLKFKLGQLKNEDVLKYLQTAIIFTGMEQYSNELSELSQLIIRLINILKKN